MLALFGEIGTTNEEDAAALIKSGGFTKPVIAYVSGRFLTRPGSRTAALRYLSSRAPPRDSPPLQGLKALEVCIVFQWPGDAKLSEKVDRFTDREVQVARRALQR